MQLEAQVDCWFVDQSNIRHESWARHLTTREERCRADKFVHYRHKSAFLIRRGFLRAILSLYTGIASDLVPIRAEPGGRPFIDTHDEISFGCSSSGRLATVAVARKHNFGIDLECLGRRTDFSQIAVSYFSVSERKIVRKLIDQEGISRSDAILYTWTLKEAYLKALGVGIPNLRDFELAERDGRLFVNRGLPNDFFGNWFFYSKRICKSAVLSIASPSCPVFSKYFFAQNVTTAEFEDDAMAPFAFDCARPALLANIDTIFGKNVRIVVAGEL